MTTLQAAGGGLPLALHIPHVVETAGSLAGFAAIIGLAVLSALYFSQARDLRRLREWAGRAPERAAEGQPGALPGRVTAVPQPPRPAAAPQPGAPAAATPAAAGPAGTNGDAAPAVAAKPDATKDADAKAEADEAEGDQAKEGEEKKDEAAKPGMPAPASAAAAAAGAGAASVVGPAVASGGTAGASAPPAPSPAPPAGAPSSPGAGPPAGPTPPGAVPTPSGPPRPSPQPQRPPGSVLPPRTGTLPPVRRLPSSNVGGAAAQTGVLGTAAQPPKPKRNPVYVVLAVAGVLIIGAAAAIGVPAIVNGTKNKSSSKTAAKAAVVHHHRAVASSPSKITVAVLNGTSVAGLAAQIGDRVSADGFTLGTVSNASQTQGQRANSVAMYSSGHEADARLVARRLGIRNVERVDPNSQQIAGDASVVVIVGSDKTQG